MNSRILALSVLILVISGCARINFPAADTPAPEQSPDTVEESGIAIGVSDEPDPDILTHIPEQDSQPEPAAAEESTDALAGDAGDMQTGAVVDVVTTPEPDQVAEVETDAQAAKTETEAVLEAAVVETGDEDALVQSDTEKQRVTALCNEIGNKLGSVSVEDCLAQPLAFAGSYTVQSRPLVVRDFFADQRREKQTRVLVLGGIHGDEYSSISIMFKWMELLEASENRDFRWRFAPTVNPDGLLDGQAVRQNANGVDLNRNFPSEDWADLAEDYWANTTSRNPRRYPGSHPASEPEVQWVVDQIRSYKPDVIVSVHAPYHLLDYDGPQEPPQKIGELHLHLLGVYPGSLGNYAGLNLGIPVVTMELPSAGIMPTREQIDSMWNDLLKWLYEHQDT